MKIIYAPMAVSLPANGPYSQFLAFLDAARARGAQVAAAAARDAAWKAPAGIVNYPVPTPKLAGWIPAWAIDPIVRPLMLRGEAGRRRTRMASFEQVQASLGLASPGYFFRDMEAIEAAARDFGPDAIVAGRYSAILAAKAAGVPSIAIIDRPQTSAFASSPARTKRLREELARRGLGSYRSVLDIAEEADLLIVPNLKEFADLGSDKAVYVGPLKPRTSARGSSSRPGAPRDTILCYTGQSGMDPGWMARVLGGSESAAGLRIVISRPGAPKRIGRVELVPSFDTREEFRRARMMIHHGGQNSCYDCLLEGIPQLAVPCGHFERSANAMAVTRIGAGLSWDEREGERAFELALGRLLREVSFSRRARELGERLESAGGWTAVLEAIEALARGRRR